MESPLLQIRLFGEFGLRRGGVPAPPLDSARAESLLAFLLLHRDAAQSRQRLAFLLWPDSTESQARTNLRHLVHNLRHALPDLDQFVEVTPRTLQWREDSPYRLDVAAFEAATARAGDANDGDLAALREAVELYTGDLLAGCYDEWLLGERERLLQQYLAALERLAAGLEVRSEYTSALAYAERLLRHDPLREETYRLLMRLHGRRGDQARALRVYHACAATLERELGVEPAAATRAAYEALILPGNARAASERQDGRAGGPPLVGRIGERARLAELWRGTERGEARFVLVTGEAGIGKTRLVEEFRTWCAHRGVATAAARSYPAEGALAYGPVVAWLRADALGPGRDHLDRAYLTELARLLPEIGAGRPDLASAETQPGGEQRLRLFDAIARAILAPGVPLLLVIDDLHWCDHETLQFLHYLLRVAPAAPLLVAATARREELDDQHPLHELLTGLRALDRCEEIELGRLTREETAALAERLTRRSLLESDAAMLFNETEGNPLFVVEALRAGWASGQAGRARLSPKVQAVMQARLAQLSAPARDLVGIAATIGREFTSDVLAFASDTNEPALVRSLDELWRRRIVREQGADAYDFSHDTIREVAYLALSPAQRRHHHLRVARALEDVNAGDPGPASGQIAAHYDRAGAASQAVPWYERAAEIAQRLHADSEAIRLLERALELLRTLPDSHERRTRELAILTALPAALVAVEGYQSSRVTEIQRHALDLTRALAIEPAPPLLRSLAIASLAHDDFGGAQHFAAQLRARGERDADAVLIVEADYVLGIAAFWQGKLAAAREHFESVVSHYRPEQRQAHLLRYGQDPKVVCLIRLACTLWFLGQPEAALRARDAGLALAEEIAHPYTRGVALTFATLLALECGEPEMLRTYLAQLTADRAENEALHFQSGIDVYLGYADVLDGRAQAGIALIQHARETARGTARAPGLHAILLRVLLEACAAAGEARLGLAAAEEMLAMGEGAGLWEAEAHHLRATFLDALGAPEQEIEAGLARALAVARRQGARAPELRAAMSLLRHRRARGDAHGAREAQDLLATLLAAFPEHQDSPDLREAAALLGHD
jgi:DNA-binding SARP family transcriptional activator